LDLLDLHVAAQLLEHAVVVLAEDVEGGSDGIEHDRPEYILA
jgi:hypothetical protein